MKPELSKCAGDG